MAVTVGFIAVAYFNTFNQRIDKRSGKLLNVGHSVVIGIWATEKVSIQMRTDSLLEMKNFLIRKSQKDQGLLLKWSMPGTVDTPFYISKNEWDKAKQLINYGELYEIHRVYNAGRDDIAVQIYRDLNVLEREEIDYKVTVKGFGNNKI